MLEQFKIIPLLAIIFILIFVTFSISLISRKSAKRNLIVIDGREKNEVTMSDYLEMNDEFLENFPLDSIKRLTNPEMNDIMANISHFIENRVIDESTIKDGSVSLSDLQNPLSPYLFTKATFVTPFSLVGKAVVGYY